MSVSRDNIAERSTGLTRTHLIAHMVALVGAERVVSERAQPRPAKQQCFTRPELRACGLGSSATPSVQQPQLELRRLVEDGYLTGCGRRELENVLHFVERELRAVRVAVQSRQLKMVV